MLGTLKDVEEVEVFEGSVREQGRANHIGLVSAFVAGVSASVAPAS